MKIHRVVAPHALQAHFTVLLLLLSVIVTDAALLSHWSFEDTGITAADSIGGRNGQLSPTGASFVPGGIVGRALELRKSQTGYVSMGNVLQLTNTPFAIVLWIKLAVGDRTDDSLFLGKHIAGGNAYVFFVNRAGAGSLGARDKVSFYSALGSSGSGVTTLTSTTSVNDGRWHQVVAVHQPGGESRLYVDGNLEHTLQSANIQDNTGSFLLGAYNQTGPVSSFTGELDEIQIFDRLLSSTEIKILKIQPSTHLDDPPANQLVAVPSARDYTNSLAFGFVNNLSIGTVYYTIDGSDPTAQSTLFVDPVVLTEGIVTVKARVFFNGFPITDVVSAVYRRVYALANDGISASWREQYFGSNYATDPRVAATADPDNDNATNLQEFVAGTNPLDALSGFALIIKMVPGITWTSLPNVRYRVLYRPTLTELNWTTLGEIVATGTSTSFAHHGVTGNTGFYAVEILP